MKKLHLCLDIPKEIFTPIFAVFITGQIKNGTVEVVGFAAAIYWIGKSIFELPIGRFLDKRKGEKDDLYFLVIGYLLVACVHFLYIISHSSWHIYILQGVYALGAAMAWPAWSALFTRHIDKGKEGSEWSMEHVAYNFGTGITGAIGGIMVAKFGFNLVFVMAGTFAIIGGLVPLFIHKDIKIKGNHHLRFWKIKS